MLPCISCMPSLHPAVMTMAARRSPFLVKLLDRYTGRQIRMHQWNEMRGGWYKVLFYHMPIMRGIGKPIAIVYIHAPSMGFSGLQKIVLDYNGGEFAIVPT